MNHMEVISLKSNNEPLVARLEKLLEAAKNDEITNIIGFTYDKRSNNFAELVIGAGMDVWRAIGILEQIKYAWIAQKEDN